MKKLLLSLIILSVISSSYSITRKREGLAKDIPTLITDVTAFSGTKLEQCEAMIMDAINDIKDLFDLIPPLKKLLGPIVDHIEAEARRGNTTAFSLVATQILPKVAAKAKNPATKAKIARAETIANQCSGMADISAALEDLDF